MPPALTVAVTADGVLKQVGTARSVYLMPLPADVMRTRRVAATPFCRTGVAIAVPPASTKVIAAEGSVMTPMRTGGLSFCSPVVPAVFVNVCMSQSAGLPL